MPDREGEAREPKRISFAEYNEDPGKWLEHSQDQQVLVESEDGRMMLVLGTTGEKLFPDLPEDRWWEDIEVDDDYEYDPNAWLR